MAGATKHSSSDDTDSDKQRSEKVFVYLASSTTGGGSGDDSKSKQLVYIGRSSHPFPRLLHHNRAPGHTEGPKETKAGAPWWRLDLILGPFQRGTHRIQKEWRERTRGHRARLQKGLEIGLREQQRLKRQIVWYNDEQSKTPHPSRSPSPKGASIDLPENSNANTRAGNTDRN